MNLQKNDSTTLGFFPYFEFSGLPITHINFVSASIQVFYYILDSLKYLKFSLKIRVRLKFVGFSLRPNFSTIQKIKVVGLIKYLRDIEFTYKLFNFKFPRT